jgi:geranylgeranyl pyrophosphate synthase
MDIVTIDEHVEVVYHILGENLAFCRPTLFPRFQGLLEAAINNRMPSTEHPPWLMLPIFTCEALGGDAEQAHHVAAALEVGRIAAACLDEWQDQDTHGALWRVVGAERTVILATAMIALSQLSLSRLADLGMPATTVLNLKREFELSLLQMCEGQDADLGDDLSLGDYEAVAGAKSGSLFRLGCRAGALVAETPAEVVARYGGFGQALGVLVQVWNDFQGLAGLRGKKDTGHRRALPILAALALDQGEYEPHSAEGRAGELYALVQLQRLHQRAAEALAWCPAPGRLSSFLDDYSPGHLVEKVSRAAPRREEGHV